MAKIAIIGGGLTGLSIAYHLEKNGFFDYQIFEKEAEHGGLCRSVQQDGFIFDYTGHLLHISDPIFKDFLETIFGFDKFHTINRNSSIYSHNTYTPYPYQMHLHGLPDDVVTECITGFATKQPLKKKNPSFLEWTTAHFGAGITKHFFEPYQKKIFACDLDDITASWTGRFVPQTTLKDIVKGALSAYKKTDVGYNSSFFYPKDGGIVQWVDALKNQLLNPLKTEHCVKHIDTQKKQLTFTNGHKEQYQTLISTMPLDNFLRHIKEPTNKWLHEAADKLRCNSVLNFNLGIKKEYLTDKHWIYFPEEQYPFYRLGFYHNLCPAMVPKGHTSVYGEIAYFKKDLPLEHKLQQALEQVKKLFKLSDADIVTQKVIAIEHAYVTYDFWREKNLPTIHKQLNEYNIHSLGRYGEWKYSSMQEAVLEAKQWVEAFLADAQTTTRLKTTQQAPRKQV